MFFIVLICNGCSQNHSTNTSINNSINKSLEFLNKKAIVSSDIQKNNLNVTIKYIENYFLGLESNKIVLDKILNENINLFSKYESCSFLMSYENLSDGHVIYYSSESITFESDYLIKNPLYDTLITTCIKDLKAGDIIGYDAMIFDLKNTYLPEHFKYKGSFWNLIKDFSLDHCDTKSQMYIDFETLHYADSVMESPMNPALLKKLITLGNQFCETN